MAFIYILSILGIISTSALIGIAVYLLIKTILKVEHEHHSMVIFADTKTSIQEGVLIYVVDNVKSFDEYWKADLSEVKLYASGKSIPSRAFKSASTPNGIKLMVSGMSNSLNDMLSIMSAIKFGLWEISFDGGTTRIPLIQIVDVVQKYEAEKIAQKNGWVPPKKEEKMNKELKKEIRKASKTKQLSKGALPQHGLLAHVNEGRSTGTSLRYQILVPKASEAVLELIEDDYNRLTFYYIYEGKGYKMESTFVDRVGSLWEWDLLGLKPGTIYTGLSTSLNGGKTMLPSSALYGITKNLKGEVPTIDEAELAKPEPGEEGFEMWNEEVAISYLGPEFAEKTYRVIVKKHYEDEYTEEYLSLSRTKDFFDDYKWLKGKKETPEEHVNIVKTIYQLGEDERLKAESEKSNNK